MIDFREYRKTIGKAVRQVKKPDSRWGWYVTDINKNGFGIYWTYLNNVGQKDDFRVTVYEDCGEVDLVGSLNGDYLDDKVYVTVGDKKWTDAKTIESGLEMMVGRIAHAAYARY